MLLTLLVLFPIIVADPSLQSEKINTVNPSISKNSNSTFIAILSYKSSIDLFFLVTSLILIILVGYYTLPVIGPWLCHLSTDQYTFYFTIYFISIVLITYRHPEFSYLDSIFNLNDYPFLRENLPLLGIVLFFIIATVMYWQIVFSITNSRDMEIVRSCYCIFEVLKFIVTWIAAIHHNNKLIGSVTIIHFYYIMAFVFGTMKKNYYDGIGKNKELGRCLLATLLLTVNHLYLDKIIENSSMSLFENGVYFWATFIGLVCMFILTDSAYIASHIGHPTLITNCIITIIMFVYCLIYIYLGTILNIAPFRYLATTFLVLRVLRTEVVILFEMFKPNIILSFLVTSINLYFLSRLVLRYSDYFFIPV